MARLWDAGRVFRITHKILLTPVRKDTPNMRYFRKFSTALLTFPTTGHFSPKIRNLSTGGVLRASSKETPEAPEQKSTLEINTKSGKLVVTTSVNKDSVESLTIEKDKKNAAKEPESASKDSSWPNKQKRMQVDFDPSPLERKFITPSRAMSDFLLKPTDLESLVKMRRRSPHAEEPYITVYSRKDVEAKAIEVWGSRENLLRECLKQEIEKKTHQQNIFTVKRRLRDYRREIGSRTSVIESETGLFGTSGKVVLTAIGINAANFLFKLFAWISSGSNSMFAECIHSLADTINQLILAFGIHKSNQMADSDHPYGYANMKYVSSLISGVGIFCVGAGLSFYHGIMGLVHPEVVEDYSMAFLILAGSLVSEGATLVVAINAIRKSAKSSQMTFREYVVRGHDPCVNVVLTEDTAAVAGVLVAGSCMGLSAFLNSPIPDAMGSLLVGGILGGVALFIIRTNVNALVGRSIPETNLKQINAELESDVMLRAIHDVKGIDMGNSLVRYKAEVDFDGRELTRSYLDKLDLKSMLEEVKSFTTIDEVELFMLKHGEKIVDLMGGEIDRIEMKLKKKYPEIRHCDLEIL
uniref:Proton-coupled zinc antiporter SLC30A9, mitochondrial n=1 Tax=Lutzomyia longipalpis TaxID=7200 RepID=A0A7G3B7D4_LUTLO